MNDINLTPKRARYKRRARPGKTQAVGKGRKRPGSARIVMFYAGEEGVLNRTKPGWYTQ